MMKKSKFKKIAAIACTMALSGALAFSLTACNNNDNNNDDGNDTSTSQGALQLNKTSATIKVGETVSLNVTSSTTGTITWSSSDTSVATVTADASNSKLATVAGVKAGTATITAKDGDNEITCSVTVQAAAEVETETVTIAGAATQYIYGTDGTLTLTAEASKGSAISWESSATSVATVADGVVTAVAAGETTITAKVSDDIKATVTVKVLAATDITSKGGINAFSNGWYYDNGGVSTKTISTCQNYGDVGAKIKYTWNWVGGDEWWNVQLFYKANDAKLVDGDHSVSLTIVASQAGNITVNGTKWVLEAGSNKVTVEHYNGATLAVAFGVENESCFVGTDVEFLIKDLVVETNVEAELKAPEFSYDAATNVITINDTQNGEIEDKAYRLGFYDEDNVFVTMVPVESGKEVDLSNVNSGTYTVKLQAYSESSTILDSDWSTSTATITVNNEYVNLDWHAEDQFTTGWAYYSMCNTTRYQMTKDSNESAGTIYYAWKGKGGNPWDAQLFYKNSAITPGEYTITLTISSTTNPNSTIKVALAPEGEKAVSAVEQDGKYVYSSTYDITATGSNTLISIMFGVDGGSMIDGGEDGIEFVVEYTITPKAAA